MRSSDEEISKHSKKLTAISFAIIVFILGGGHFNQKPEYFSGIIGFDNIYVIPITVVIVFIFYWYRFWIWQRKPIHHSRSQLYKSLKADTKFRKYFEEKSREEIRNRVENEIEIDGKVWNMDDRGKPVKANYNPNLHKETNLFSNTITSNIVDSGNRDKGNLEITLDAKRYFHIARVKLKSVIYNKEYTYRVLPFWLAIIAAICILYSLVKNYVWVV
ncbi:MAG: hypothetical protein ACQETL_20235 [Bacteroidota bacterium]